MKETSPSGGGGESHLVDYKSLRAVVGKTADFSEIAKDCVAFANSAGGQLRIGIEDGESRPPARQRVPASLLDLLRKRISELTVNVQAAPQIVGDDNGGEFVVLSVSRSMGVASTSDGRYFIRVGDTCQPVVGDDVLRLANERPAMPWEAMATLPVTRSAADSAKVKAWAATIHASDRVKSSVKEKSDDELLEHYGLIHGGILTNLGVLMLGTRADRARLGTAPVVQAIKYDERGVKVGKHVWDDYALTPWELIDAVWQEVPDFRETYELPEGMFRTAIPAFEEVVVRELLVNALVHRPYTQRGDIFVNLHPDRLEVVNPGRLPLGVTPQNILHASRRRNDGMARIFHDMRLMEREGSGFDLIYEHLLASGRGAPVATEGADSVHVTIPRRVVQPGVIRLLAQADQKYQLSQRERIVLGLVGQTEGLSATEVVKRLELEEPAALRSWITRLLQFGLLETSGRTKATRYFVPASLLRTAGLDKRTTLTRMQPHRLRALVQEDVGRFPNSSISEIHRRVAPEISARTIKRVIQHLLEDGHLIASGERRWRRYQAARPIDRQKPGGR